jgi:YfiH family protein
MIGDFNIIRPDWYLHTVKACTVIAYDKAGSRVSFDKETARGLECRNQLAIFLKVNNSIEWINQVHGTNIVNMPLKESAEADGSMTTERGVVCEVITADCLPVVFADKSGTVVGIVHAGRRGLLDNIISCMIKKMNVNPADILVWIGPGIAVDNYEITDIIRNDFLKVSADYAPAFKYNGGDKYLLDLYMIAKIQLKSLGILQSNIYGAEWDTFSDKRFHSARRDKDHAGRMATLVWID